MALVGRDELSKGYHHDYPGIVLNGGVKYIIIVQADYPGVGFDLDVFDENDNMVQTAPSVGDFTGCYVTPRWRGQFTIRVKCLRGTSSYTVKIDAVANVR